MDRTTQHSAAPSRVHARRALALAVALTLPLLSACRSGEVDASGTPVPRSTASANSVVVAGAESTSEPGDVPVAVDLDGPRGLAVAGHFDFELGGDGEQSGNYIADTGHARVLVAGLGQSCVLVAAVQEQPDDLAWCTEPPLVRPELKSPTALAVDDAGDLYIADPSAHQVFTVDAQTGEFSTVAGSGVDGAPRNDTVAVDSPLRAPAGLAVTGDGSRLYIADAQAHQVLVVAADEGAEEDGDAAPGPLAEEPSSAQTPPSVDSADLRAVRRVAVSSSSSSAPVAVGPSRLFVVAGTGCAPAGGAGRPAAHAENDAWSTALSAPTAIAVDGEQILVTDPGNHQVYGIDMNAPGAPAGLRTLSSDDPALMQPVGLTVVHGRDGAQRLVAVDTETRRVVQTPLGDGPLTWSVASPRFAAPTAVVGSGSPFSDVYVADTGADSVIAVTLPQLLQPSESPLGPTDSSEDELPPPDELLLEVRTTTDDVDVHAQDVRSYTPGTCAVTTASSPAGGSSTGDRDPVITPAAVPSGARPKVPSQVSVPEAGTHRLAGADRVATAVDSSKQLFPKAGSAPTVVISSSSSFTDAAGGARLAAELGGPLLLTSSGSLDASVAAEVQRVLSAGGGVVVVGGEKAVNKDVVDALQRIAPDRVERVSGDDRYASAVALAERLTKVGGSSSTAPIYLVTGKDHPDALVVVALARRTGGVVVLSDGDRLPAVTRAYLLAQDPTGARTVPVGGAAAKAAATLDGDAGGRASAAAVVGTDRYDTARLVAERFAALDARDGARTAVVGLATGKDWPDALVGSTAMGSLVGPLLLNQGADLAPATAKALTALSSGSRPTTFLVFGGEKAVPASAAKAFGAAAQG